MGCSPTSRSPRRWPDGNRSSFAARAGSGFVACAGSIGPRQGCLVVLMVLRGDSKARKTKQRERRHRKTARFHRSLTDFRAALFRAVRGCLSVAKTLARNAQCHPDAFARSETRWALASGILVFPKERAERLRPTPFELGDAAITSASPFTRRSEFCMLKPVTSRPANTRRPATARAQ